MARIHLTQGMLDAIISAAAVAEAGFAVEFWGGCESDPDFWKRNRNLQRARTWAEQTIRDRDRRKDTP